MNQDKNSKHSDYYRRRIWETGSMAGVLLLLFSGLSYTFHFMNWNPLSVLPDFRIPKALLYGIAALLSVLLSVVLSLLYYALLRKRKPFISGVCITIFFFIIIYLMTDHSPLHLVTIFALLLGYFLFISVTISWHYERGK